MTESRQTTRGTVKGGEPKEDLGALITQSLEIMKSFNPVTHSIDTHIMDKLGDTSKPGTAPEKVFVQQVVYGCFKEKPLIDGFISSFYADNAANISRIDMDLYKVFAYLAVCRLAELRFPRFRDFCASQNATKMIYFLGYLFNKDNLESSMKANWIRVLDLTYVEEKIIQGILTFVPHVSKYIASLEGDMVAQAANAEQAKADAEAAKEAKRKPPTIPKGPKLSKRRPPRIPEPIEIKAYTEPHGVPSYLNRTNVAQLEEERSKRRADIRKSTQEAYDDSLVFKFNESKAGKSLESLRREKEEREAANLQFSNSYTKPVPNFTAEPASVRLNVSTVLREDYLFRKQQAKDAALLKNYEEEVRDSTEYYLWQKKLQKNDELVKLRQVTMRREQSKQSGEEARAAILAQQEGNRAVVSILREQAEVITKKRELQKEIAQITKQESAKSVAAARDSLPKIAVEKVLAGRKVTRDALKDDLEARRAAKAAADAEEEAIRADKIRQQRAVNTIHKRHITVFDPTQTAGPAFLDSCSYMEMKERQVERQNKVGKVVTERREDILEAKMKRAKDLEDRTRAIMKLRQAKSEATAKLRHESIARQAREEAERERARGEAAFKLNHELSDARIKATAEAQALEEERERVMRKQLFMGAGASQAEEKRFSELTAAKERKLQSMQVETKKSVAQYMEVKKKESRNKNVVMKQAIEEKTAAEKEALKELIRDKRLAVERMKATVVLKKEMATAGREQFARTKQVRIDHNPYAETINQNIHIDTLNLRSKAASTGVSSSSRVVA